MYIIIFEDRAIRKIDELDESCVVEVEDGIIDIIDQDKMKVMLGRSDGEIVWEDIKQIQ